MLLSLPTLSNIAGNNMARQIRKKSGTGIYHVTLRNGRIDKYQFEEGYCQAERYVYDASQDEFTFCYYDRDHLGNIRQVTEADGSSVGSVIQTMNYYPFGAEFCDGTANSSVQPYKYNGKELDMLNGLNMYDFGARLYDVAGVPMWTSIDPLCEKYYSLSPYAYCANNPIRFIDPTGKEVYAENSIVIRNICNTLTQEERAYVKFQSNGLLDVALLNKCNSSSNNFTALKLLSNSQTKYYINVGEVDMDGNPFYNKGTIVGMPDNYRYGVTFLPGAENSPSPDENVYIYTASFLDEKKQACNTAHEAYGHAYFYELSKSNPIYNPYHTRGVVGNQIEHDPVFGDYEVPIFGQTNKLLEEQIKKVEQETIDNYEKSH